MTIEDFGTPIDEETAERNKIYSEINQLYEKLEKDQKRYGRGVLITKKDNSFKILSKGETEKIEKDIHEFRTEDEPYIYIVELDKPVIVEKAKPSIIRYTEPTRFFGWGKPKDNDIITNLEKVIQKEIAR